MHHGISCLVGPFLSLAGGRYSNIVLSFQGGLFRQTMDVDYQGLHGTFGAIRSPDNQELPHLSGYTRACFHGTRRRGI